MEIIMKICKWILGISLVRRTVEKNALKRLHLEAFDSLIDLRIELKKVPFKLNRYGNLKETMRRKQWEPDLDPINELCHIFHMVHKTNEELKSFRETFVSADLPKDARVIWEEIDCKLRYWFYFDNSMHPNAKSPDFGVDAKFEDTVYIGGPQFYDVWERNISTIKDKWASTPLEYKKRYACQAWGFLLEFCEPTVSKLYELESKLLY